MKNLALWNDVKESISDYSMNLGPYFSRQCHVDPKHVLFTLSRYKFAARLIGESPKRDVLELGCNEGLGTMLLAQHAAHVLAVDFDTRAIAWSQDQVPHDNIQFLAKDFLNERFGAFDAAVSIDVIEHIPREQEDQFAQTLTKNLKPEGICIVGTPNVTAAAYACQPSQIGHVNLFNAQRLKDLFQKYFHNVFIFGLNDEVVHTGFYAMCHYLFVLACYKKDLA